MTHEWERLYWRTNKAWYGFDSTINDFYLTDDVPENVKRSFDLWQEQRKKNTMQSDLVAGITMATHHH